jgi:predicted nucleic acid-binding Zn ribbon protein
MTWRPLPSAATERAPLPVSASLDAVTRSIGAPRAGVLATIFGRWPELVGRDVAAHSAPQSLRGGSLVVAVDQPAWATQLRWLSADLIRCVAAATGGDTVQEVQVVVRPSIPRPRSGGP